MQGGLAKFCKRIPPGPINSQTFGGEQGQFLWTRLAKTRFDVRINLMAERVTIVGDGAMATVCSILLTQGGHEAQMWGAFEASIERLLQDREQRTLLPGVRIPDSVKLTANDAECFDGCTMILSAVPTQYLRSVWQRLSRYVPAGVPIVSATKGIENDSLLRPTQIIADVLGGKRLVDGQWIGPRCDWPLVAMSGPNIAAEIARYLPATAVAASEDAAAAGRVQSAFSTQWFRVYTNDDVVGVELAGAIKNVIALAAGILDGLAAGNNAKAALVTRGLVEISRLGVAMGARDSTFAGLAGLGDLVTTCISPEGRNRRVGEQIGRGQKLKDVLTSMESVAEGVPTTRAVMELARRHNIPMPITEAVYAVLFEDKEVITALTELMTRQAKPEQGAVS